MLIVQLVALLWLLPVDLKESLCQALLLFFSFVIGVCFSQGRFLRLGSSLISEVESRHYLRLASSGCDLAQPWLVLASYRGMDIWPTLRHTPVPVAW